MCLEKIIKSYKRKQSGVGWKIFRYNSDTKKIRSLHKGNEHCIPTDRFINEGKYRSIFNFGSDIRISRDETYPYGFHIFMNKQDAILNGGDVDYRTVRKVKYKGGHTKGIDLLYEKPTIVATEICVGRNI